MMETVTKANIEEEWSKAVILKDETIKYRDNDAIPEDNIESYFVWIPRYGYKIFNDETYGDLTEIEDRVQTVELNFEFKNTTPSNGSHKIEWLTHPAFTSFDTNGIWVGKFETSKSNTVPDNSINEEEIQVKPNVVNWRNIQVGNAFYTSYNYKREMDSHMMKNSKWVSVTYLQHSKYGSGMSFIFNNNSNFLTRYSWSDEKYYDKYAYGTSYSEFTRGHLGDATVEMGPFTSNSYISNWPREVSSWYFDYANFSYNSNPWFTRGGTYTDGSDAGQFSFNDGYGSVNNYSGFRIVLFL